jgi:hypothetical protein
VRDPSCLRGGDASDSDTSPAAHEVKHDHDDGDHKQHMNEGGRDMKGEEAEQPHHDENQGDYSKHCRLLPMGVNAPGVAKLTLLDAPSSDGGEAN